MNGLDTLNPKERWVPIEGFPGYEVSDFGQVRSLPRISGGSRNVRVPGKMMTCTISNGYPRVTLTIGGKHFYREIHRLVALAFLGPCPDGHEVRHIFGDSTQAALSGLAYGTRAQNIADCKKHGGFRNGAAHLTENHVRQIAASAEPISILAKRYNISQGVIWSIRSGRAWTHLNLTINPNRRTRIAAIPVETVRAITADAGTVTEIAARHGVSRASVSHIRRTKRAIDEIARDQVPSGDISSDG